MPRLRAFVVVCFVSAGVLAPPPAAAHDLSCTGVAPVLVTCSTGQHVRGGEFIQHGPDLEARSVYTGSIVSYLASGSGNVKRTCDIILGEVERCVTDDFSTWPKVGESFEQLCFSYFLGTEDRGGIGPWGCFVRHE